MRGRVRSTSVPLPTHSSTSLGASPLGALTRAFHFQSPPTLLQHAPRLHHKFGPRARNSGSPVPFQTEKVRIPTPRRAFTCAGRRVTPSQRLHSCDFPAVSPRHLETKPCFDIESTFWCSSFLGQISSSRTNPHGGGLRKRGPFECPRGRGRGRS